jgi:hypothetical protein
LNALDHALEFPQHEVGTVLEDYTVVHCAVAQSLHRLFLGKPIVASSSVNPLERE